MTTELVKTSIPSPSTGRVYTRKSYKIGVKVNSLTLKEFSQDETLPSGRVHRMGVFLCDCGNTKTMRLSRVFSKEVKACGCQVGKALVKSQTTHGLTHTREFHIWNNMLYRCNSVTSKDYHKYGGRGITVCERWSLFENFLEDMGKAPSEKHTLDRVDNYRGYEPDNCRWATAETQMNNRRDTKKFMLDGLLLSRAQIARRLGLKESDVYYRMKTGFTVEQLQEFSLIRQTKEYNDLTL